MSVDALRTTADSLAMVRVLVISALIASSSAAWGDPTLDLGIGVGALSNPYGEGPDRATALDVQLATKWAGIRSIFVELGGVQLAHSSGSSTGHNLDVFALGVRWQPGRWWFDADAGAALMSETSVSPFLAHWSNPEPAPAFGLGVGWTFYDRPDLALGAALHDQIALTSDGPRHALGLVFVTQLRFGNRITAPWPAAGPLSAAR